MDARNEVTGVFCGYTL